MTAILAHHLANDYAAMAAGAAFTVLNWAVVWLCFGARKGGKR